MKVICVFIFLSVVSVAMGYNISAVAEFANSNWMCGNLECSVKVTIGQFQPNYQCAEFVSRSLAAGGFIPNLGPYDSQNAFYTYRHNGVAYDLLWVSSKQGMPLGLEDLLKTLGWTQTDDKSTVEAGYALMLVGSDGPYSHTAVGVASGLTDAHNAAHHLAPLSVYEGVNMIYAPPK